MQSGTSGGTPPYIVTSGCQFQICGILYNDSVNTQRCFSTPPFKENYQSLTTPIGEHYIYFEVALLVLPSEYLYDLEIQRNRKNTKHIRPASTKYRYDSPPSPKLPSCIKATNALPKAIVANHSAVN